MSASDVSPLFTACFTLLSDTCRWLVVWLVFVLRLGFCLVCVACRVVLFFASGRVVFSFFSYTAIGDRQCFHARSARR